MRRVVFHVALSQEKRDVQVHIVPAVRYETPPVSANRIPGRRAARLASFRSDNFSLNLATMEKASALRAATPQVSGTDEENFRRQRSEHTWARPM